MVACLGAARPRTSWSKSATRSQLRGSRPWPTRGRHACGSRKACGQKKQVSQVRGAKQEVPKHDHPLWQCPGPHASRGPRAWTEWVITLRSKILSMHGVGEAHAKHQEKRDNRPLPRHHLGGSCELRARLMRCFDGPEQQRRDPHTSRAQRARERCAYARTGWSAKFMMDGLVTSARDASLNLPHFRYHSIVAP